MKYTFMQSHLNINQWILSYGPDTTINAILFKITFEGQCDLDLSATDLGLWRHILSRWDKVLFQVISKSIHKCQSHRPDTTINTLLCKITFNGHLWPLSCRPLNEAHIYVKLFKNPSINWKVMDWTPSMHFYIKWPLKAICGLDLQLQIYRLVAI